MSEQEQSPFHKHLDICNRCDTRPFDLCSIGSTLLRLEAAHGIVEEVILRRDDLEKERDRLFTQRTNKMKIEIEITDNEKATLTIDGRNMTVEKSNGGCVTSLEGIEGQDMDNTLAGIIAGQIYSKIGDIMQANENAEHAGVTSTWEIVSESTAEAIEEPLF